MHPRTSEILRGLVDPELGEVRARDVLSRLDVPDLSSCRARGPGKVTRGQIAMALSVLLFDDVTRRVPWGAAYALECRSRGRPLFLDHGGVRTVATPCGELPAGIAGISRLLEPLGYRRVGVYPLDALGMTGTAWAHADAAEVIPQYFVSELHPERFSPAFRDAVARVVGASVDPLSSIGSGALEELGGRGELPTATAVSLLPVLTRAFDRQHPIPHLADYELLRSESPEMAWIATEGQSFNHATDRVDDVDAICRHQRAMGRPVKDEVAVSGSGRVRQSAFRAALVERRFVGEEGAVVTRVVPGSFWEFISRERFPDGRIDLAFDAGNATEIFDMTSARTG